MSSRRNNTLPKFVHPEHFFATSERASGPRASYTMADVEYNHGIDFLGYLLDGYEGTKTVVSPYQRAPTTRKQRSATMTTSQAEISLPSHQWTEQWLRSHLKIPAPQPLNLWCMQELANLKKLPNLTEMIFLAIWGSPYRRLGLSEIYDAIEERYPALKTVEDKVWKRSIRHRLSLKACFVRIQRGKRGADWMLDVSKGLQNSRCYKTSPPQNTSGSSSDQQYQSGDDGASPLLGYSSDSDAFLTSSAEMSSAIGDYFFASSSSSIYDVSEGRMGNEYDLSSFLWL